MKKIMLIDDDWTILESVSEVLSAEGYKIQTFGNPCKAIQEYDPEQFDVVITDFRMPKMSGLEVLKTIMKRKEDAYVIMMTGYTDVDFIIETLNSGAYAFLRKPLDLSLLYDTLSKIEKELQQDRDKEDKENVLTKLYLEYQNLESNLKAF